jgi:S1-C subfamily serine protease
VSGDNNGLGFAIPIDVVYERAERLAAGESIETALLGVELPTDVQASDDDAPGAYIGVVTPGSGADQAGLESGDEVVAINGESVRDFGELSTQIVNKLPGDTVELTVERDGDTLTLTATLGSRPDD